MMASETLGYLSDLGVHVEVDGAKLRLIPGSLVPLTLVSEIRAHKDELLEELRQAGAVELDKSTVDAATAGVRGAADSPASEGPRLARRDAPKVN